jgi:hypothetical protein
MASAAPPIPVEPYLPVRFAEQVAHEQS